ncbi:hypothetical protein [Ohessyouella blattaphilus]|uniref:hypothetical protein n=1 Tax=Ohessyouella blattaphilus TaxID=2949333 RepID=UPI003EB7EC5C
MGHKLTWDTATMDLSSSQKDLARLYVDNHISLSELAQEIGSSKADLVSDYVKQATKENKQKSKGAR